MSWLAEKLFGLLGIRGAAWLLLLLAFSCGTAAGWRMNGWRMAASVSAVREELADARLRWDRERMEAERAHSAAIIAAREKEAAWREAAHVSEKENAELRKKNGVAAAAARDAAVRLRDEGNRITGELNRMPEHTPIPASVSPAPQPMLSGSAASDIRRWRERMTGARSSEGR